MSSYSLTCRLCEWSGPVTERPSRCPDCGARLEVAFDTLPERLVTDESRYDVYRYADWLPVSDADWLSNGEGWTPLVETSGLVPADAEPETTVLLKNETTNPTWSWKDRMATQVVSRAVDAGADRIATSTTGNHGSAIAAYAARAGIDRTLVIVNPASEAPHHAQIRSYGAETVELTEPTESERLLSELANRGWFVAYGLDDAYTAQPFVYEGYKTIAFELVEQNGVPDAVVAAVGAGDGLYGVWKGFKELETAGVVEETPAMVSAEASERQPLAKAYRSGTTQVGKDHGPEPLNTSTKSPTTGDHALSAVKDSGGRPTVVDTGALQSAFDAVGASGVFLEPASVLATAGARQLAAKQEYDCVVAIGSGAGVTWPQKTATLLSPYPTVEPSLEEIEDAVSFDLD